MSAKVQSSPHSILRSQTSGLRARGEACLPREFLADIASSIGATRLSEHAYRFHPKSTDFDIERVLRFQGYSQKRSAHPAIRKLADHTLALGKKVIEPSVYFCDAPVIRVEDSGLLLAGGELFDGPVFDKHLSGCHHVIPFIVTTGKALDDKSAELCASERLVEAVFLQSVGTLAIDDGTRQFMDAIERELKQFGFGITRRIAPGYTYRIAGQKVMWSLYDQQTLFKLFRGAKIGVELLDSCTMDPKMSRSGMLGIFQLKDNNVRGGNENS